MKNLYETIMDVSLNIKNFDKNIFNFGDYFIPRQYEINGDMNMLDFNKIKSDAIFKGYDGIDIINKDHLNESKNDDLIKSLVKLIGGINIKSILKSPSTYIYIKLADSIYNLIKHYIKTGNLKLLNVEINRYNENEFIVIISYGSKTISILFENKRNLK